MDPRIANASARERFMFDILSPCEAGAQTCTTLHQLHSFKAAPSQGSVGRTWHASPARAKGRASWAAELPFRGNLPRARKVFLIALLSAILSELAKLSLPPWSRSIRPNIAAVHFWPASRRPRGAATATSHRSLLRHFPPHTSD